MPNDDETLIHPEQPHFLLPTWVWAVLLFISFGAIVAVTFGAMHRGSTYEQDRAQAREEKLKTAREDWNKEANTYGWIDKEHGVAHVPIARAMQLELADLQARKPAAAGPIPTPEPSAVPVIATGAGQPANPPLATPAASASATPLIQSVEGPKNPEIHGQPTGVANPPNNSPGTQPGANATPAAAARSRIANPPVSPTGTPVLRSVGTPLPVRGATPRK